MEFFQSYDPKLMKKVLFKEQLDAIIKENTVGSWTSSVSLTTYGRSVAFYVEKKVKVQDEDRERSIKSTISAYVDKHLTTLKHVKYDVVKEYWGFSRGTKTTLLKVGDAYQVLIQKMRHEKEVHRRKLTVQPKSAFGFITEGAAVIFLRLLALCRIDDIITLNSFNSRLNTCDVLFVPEKHSEVRLYENDYEAHKIRYIFGYINRTTPGWETYYAFDGRLLLATEDKKALMFQISPDAPDFPAYFGEETGIGLLESITKDELDKIMFLEENTVRTLDGTTVGHRTFFVDESLSFDDSFYVELSTVFEMFDISFHRTISSHLTNNLETVECSDFITTRVNNKIRQKIQTIRKIDGEFIAKTTVQDGEGFISYSLSFDGKGFVSEASGVLIQRILALRDFRDKVDFFGIDDVNEICKVIFRRNKDLAGEVGIEWAIISDSCQESVWICSLCPEKFSTLEIKQPGVPVIIDNPVVSYKATPSPPEGFVNYASEFTHGLDFLRVTDIREILSIAFSEKMDVLSANNERIGELKIEIDCSNFPDDFRVKSELHMNLNGAISSVSMDSRLDVCLDTRELTIESTMMEGKKVVKTTTTVQKLGSKYYLSQENTVNQKLTSSQNILVPPPDVPFISEAAIIILQRLMIRRKVMKSCRFSTFRTTDLHECLASFELHPREMMYICGTNVLTSNIHCSFGVGKYTFESWKSKFTHLGNLVHQTREKGSSKLIFVQSPPIGEDDLYPINLEAGMKVRPVFSRRIEEEEKPFLLTSDNLTIVTESGNSVGTFVSTVHLVEHLGEKVFKVVINKEMVVDGSPCETSVISLVDNYLETIEYNRAKYFEMFVSCQCGAECDSSQLPQQLIHHHRGNWFFRCCKSRFVTPSWFTGEKEKNAKNQSFLSVKRDTETDSYEVKCSSIQDGRITVFHENIPNSDMVGFLSEASGLLVIRLMILRAIDDSLIFFCIDKLGKRKELELRSAVASPLKIILQRSAVASPLKINEGVLKLPVVEIIISGGNNEYSTMSFECTNAGGIVRSCDLANGIKMVCHEISAVGEFPSHLATQPVLFSGKHQRSNDFLHSIDLVLTKDILEDISLVLFSKDNEIVGNGEINFVAKFHHQGEHTVLIKKGFSYKLEEVELAFDTDIITNVSTNLRILEHSQTVTKQKGDVTMTKNVSYKVTEKGGVISTSAIHNNVEQPSHQFVIEDKDGFITDSVIFLIQRFMARTHFCEVLQFNTIDMDGNRCLVTLSPLGLQRKYIFETYMELYCVETELAPKRKSSLVWRSYFTKAGHLMYYKSVGSSFFFRISSSPNLPLNGSFDLHMLHNKYFSSFLKQFYILSSMSPDFFEGTRFSETMEVFSESGDRLGEFFIKIDCLYPMGEQLFQVQIESLIQIEGETCQTTIDAIINSNMETRNYFQQDDFESADKSFNYKMYMHLKKNTYLVHREILKEKGSKIENIQIADGEVPGLFTEVSGLLFLLFAANRKLLDPIDCFVLHSEYNVCKSEMRNVRPSTITVSETEVNLMKMCMKSMLEDESESTWNYYFLRDGHLGFPLQEGTKVKIPPENRSSTLILGTEGMAFPDCSEKKRAIYFEEYRQVTAQLYDFLYFILTGDPNNMYSTAEDYFKKG